MNKVDEKIPVILITEDDISNFLMIEVMIHQYVSASVLWAKDGHEAIEFCSKHPEIELVLMDIKLPLMSGLDATIAIKRMRPNLPIVAVTAYALLGDERKIREAGCNDYIAKPIRLPLFLETIGKYVPVKE
jgi:CheY-like chemotaxis protein